MPRLFDNIDQSLLPALQETLQLSNHADLIREIETSHYFGFDEETLERYRYK